MVESGRQKTLNLGLALFNILQQCVSVLLRELVLLGKFKLTLSSFEQELSKQLMNEKLFSINKFTPVICYYE